MAVLTAARFVAITDALAAAMLRAKGDATNGLGDSALDAQADTGLRGRLGTLETDVLDFEEGEYADFVLQLRKSQDKSHYQAVIPTALAATATGLTKLVTDAAIAGVSDVNGFATYYNTGSGGPYLALLAPDWTTLHDLLYGADPTATNVYSPAVAFGSRAIAGSTTAAFVNGSAVDTTKYAGAGLLQAVVSGLTFAGGTTTGTVTVTGTARTATGTTVAGRTWSGNFTANGTITLTPAVAGDLCTDVSDIAFTAGITDVSVAVNGAVPAGRTNPPV